SDLTNTNVRADTASFSVVPIHGVAVGFEFSGIRLDYYAGHGAEETDIYFTLTVKDYFGDTADGYRGTVHFTSTNDRDGLPGDYTFTQADHGPRGNLSVHVVRPFHGGYTYHTLDAADTANRFILGQSVSFRVYFDPVLPSPPPGASDHSGGQRT